MATICLILIFDCGYNDRKNWKKEGNNIMWRQMRRISFMTTMITTRQICLVSLLRSSIVINRMLLLKKRGGMKMWEKEYFFFVSSFVSFQSFICVRKRIIRRNIASERRINNGILLGIFFFVSRVQILSK